MRQSAAGREKDGCVRRQGCAELRLAVEPEQVEVAAGVSAEASTSAQVLAFIEELKRAAGES